MKHRPMRFLLCTMIGMISCLVSPAVAEPVVSLPLDGYYRPGKFFPVTVTSDQSVNVQIDVDGGVGSRGSGTAITLPVMLLSNTSRSLRATVDGKPTDLPIRPLAENERLAIAQSSALAAKASSLFPGQLVVSVVLPLDRIGPLGQAYESADVALWQGLDESAAFNKAMDNLPVGNLTMAVLIAEPAKPWKYFNRLGGWSVLDLPPRGPVDSLDNPSAYDAMTGFSAARPIESRKGVFLGMAVFAILALAASLLGRRNVFVVGAIAIVWLAGGAIYFARQSPISQWDAVISSQSDDDEIQQMDFWTIRASLQQRPDEYESGIYTRPIFGGHANLLAMWIEVTPSTWRYHYTLPRGGKMAFLSRVRLRYRGGPGVSYWQTQNSMARDLARRFYWQPGDIIENFDIEKRGSSDNVFVHPKT